MRGVRAISAADCEQVLRINAQCLPGVAPLDRAECGRLVAMPNEHLAIDGPGGRLLGYLLAFRSDSPYDGEEFLNFVELASEPFMYIDQIAVEAGFRRRSVASVLYSALERRARSWRGASLCCEIDLSPPNPISLAFHSNKGFVQTGSLNTMDGRTVALMTKRLVIMETEARET
jgi:predicted GNAT superfamily acetyltransferase